MPFCIATAGPSRSKPCVNRVQCRILYQNEAAPSGANRPHDRQPPDAPSSRELQRTGAFGKRRPSRHDIVDHQHRPPAHTLRVPHSEGPLRILSPLLLRQRTLPTRQSRANKDAPIIAAVNPPRQGPCQVGALVVAPVETMPGRRGHRQHHIHRRRIKPRTKRRLHPVDQVVPKPQAAAELEPQHEFPRHALKSKGTRRTVKMRTARARAIFAEIVVREPFNRPPADRAAPDLRNERQSRQTGRADVPRRTVHRPTAHLARPRPNEVRTALKDTHRNRRVS